jgi:O-antigen ligase
LLKDLSRHTLKSLPQAICIGLLALMVSGPFLLPFHTQPIPSFWNEWWAGALGLAAGVAVLATIPGPWVLPRLLGIPAVMLLALLIQFWFGRLAFPQVGLLYSAYLLWAGLLLLAGRRLADAVGLARVAEALALAFALGALFGAALALAQWLGLSNNLPWVFPRTGGGIYANLGQANHHAHYSWLGIVSLFYLRGRGWLRRPVLWLAILPIALGSVISGSRSVFLYPLILILGIAWARRREPRGAVANLLPDAAVLLPAMIALELFGSWLSFHLPETTTMSATRLYESVSGPSIRMALARTAWTVFLEQPWTGQGAGNFPWASFTAAVGQSSDSPFQVAEHAHNFILQGLAEFGAPATLSVACLLLLWAKRFAAKPWGLEEFWCAVVLGIGATHALLEYPLWYSYFLGPTVLLLGATDEGKAMAIDGYRLATYALLAGLAGATILTTLRMDYAVLEAAGQPFVGDLDPERAWRNSMDRLQELYRDSLLSPWALLAFAELAEPSRQQQDSRVILCERGIRFAPSRSLMTRCAIQLAISGRASDGQRLVKSVLRAFPAEREATLEELARHGVAHPEALQLRHSSSGN